MCCTVAEQFRLTTRRLHPMRNPRVLGLPGLLTAEQTAALLAKRDIEIRRKARASRARNDELGAEIDLTPWEELARLRREVNAAVAAVAASTGSPTRPFMCGYADVYPVPIKRGGRSPHCVSASSHYARGSSDDRAPRLTVTTDRTRPAGRCPP